MLAQGDEDAQQVLSNSCIHVRCRQNHASSRVFSEYMYVIGHYRLDTFPSLSHVHS